MLLSAQIVSLLWGLKEFRIVDVILIGGIGPIGDGISSGHDVGGAGHLTGWLTHGLRGWVVVLAVGVVAKAGVLESVFAFGAMNVGFRRAVEVDDLSFGNFSISRWSRGACGRGCDAVEQPGVYHSEWARGQWQSVGGC